MKSLISLRQQAMPTSLSQQVKGSPINILYVYERLSLLFKKGIKEK